MDIKQLIYFVEVAKEKSFTKAAANCYVSQPALSKSIRHLEEELDSRLFIRDGAIFELTKEGEILFADATNLIDNFHNIRKNIEMTRTHLDAPIKIAVSPFLGNLFFGKIIAEFCALNPGLPISYYETDKLSLISPNFIKTMDISLLLSPQKEFEVTGDYDVSNLMPCNLMGLVSHQHGFEKKNNLSLQSFLRETIITTDDVLQIINANDLNPLGKKHVFSALNAEYVQNMILHKEGLLILPDFIAKSMAANPRYKLLELEYDITCRLVLIAKKNVRYSKILEKIQRYIFSEFNLKYRTL
ncbi:LysR family transcriptional regulator [Fusibacter ferrireducens]|uniref:LysR family transcriptional regulator n=1 Tax=Fusibacter ferrireducens TaxID=2785058 RepID=A0ABR9ZV91_9FIRM|nr:LysR family transcriptional regulator [Fusibacter ferrireducens]MBF4694376.1 LysR family transcriptional regulator [Fusibacter ferrireducens]